MYETSVCDLQEVISMCLCYTNITLNPGIIFNEHFFFFFLTHFLLGLSLPRSLTLLPVDEGDFFLSRKH